MTNPTVQRLIIIGSVILSALTIFLCAAGILVTWFLNFAASQLVIDLSVASEQTAQSLQRGVARMETATVNLQTEVLSISQASAQISQNIADQGLARTLLPPERFTRLDQFTERVTTTFDAVGDALTSARATYTAINRIPGVNLPQPAQNTTSELSEHVAQLRSDVQEAKAGIQRVRDGGANTVNQLAEVADRISMRLDELLARLDAFNTTLDNIQLAAQQTRRTVPNIFTIIAIILTLLQVWVIYTQVIIFRQSWARWRTPEPMRPPPQEPVTLAPLATRESVDTPPAAPATDLPPLQPPAEPPAAVTLPPKPPDDVPPTLTS